MGKIIDPNEWVGPNRVPFGLRWFWQRFGGWFQ